MLTLVLLIKSVLALIIQPMQYNNSHKKKLLHIKMHRHNLNNNMVAIKQYQITMYYKFYRHEFQKNLINYIKYIISIFYIHSIHINFILYNL